MPAPEFCLFAAEPLDRASDERTNPDWVAARLSDPDSILVPMWRGDPLTRGNDATFLSAAARREFPPAAPIAFLGLQDGKAHFAIDVSDAPDPAAAPFADIGRYMPLREAASVLAESDLAIIGHARWLFDWHRRHRFCANCGAPTTASDGGAKRQCAECKAEHFPRSDPVAIVLAVHEDACLLGRSPRFPPGYLSALAGFVEAAETPEACAIRELREEAGVVLSNVRYHFSQPWPFPSSLMMGFTGDAADRNLKLDQKEIEEARWIDLGHARKLLDGGEHDGVRLPPRFTIARRLIEKWAGDVESHR